MEYTFQVEELFDKAGRKNRYQYMVITLFFLLFGMVEFFIICLPFLEAKPKVAIMDGNKQIITTINYTICNAKNISYEIEPNISFNSIVYEFEIYCNETATSLIGMSLFLGILVGALVSHIFIDRLGRKWTLLLFELVYIISLSTVFMMKYLTLLYIYLFTSGISISILVVTLLIYIGEVVTKEKTPIAITVIVSAFSVIGIVYTLLFHFISQWKVILAIVIGSNIILFVWMIAILKESPFYCMMTGNLSKLIESLREIAEFNRRKLDDTEIQLLESIHKQTFYNVKSTRHIESLLDTVEKRSMNVTEQFLLKTDMEAEKNFSSNDNNNTHMNEEKKDGEQVEVIFSGKEETIKINLTKVQADDILREKSGSFCSVTSDENKKKLKTINEYSLLDLINLKSQRGNFLTLGFLWFTSSIIFQGLNMYSKNILDDTHLSKGLFFAIDVLFLYSAYFISAEIGRVKMIISLQLVSFLTFMFCLLSDEYNRSLVFFLCVTLSRACWVSLTSIVYAINTEIYPTVLSAKGLGYNSAFGRLGGIITLFLIEKIEPYVMIVIYCAFSIFGVVFSFVLPETFSLHENPVYHIPKEES